MKAAAGTDRGLVREINEDSYNLIAGDEGSPCAFIIADGMGGHSCGEIASRMAVDYISGVITGDSARLLSAENREDELRRLVLEANTMVYHQSLEQPETKGMGTTLTMALVEKEIVTAAHVGDSRLYLIRSGEIRQLTEDHSYIEEMVKKGSMTRKEAENHPRKNVITRAVGCSEELEVDTLSITMKLGDILIFCTDGLTNMIGEDEIADTVQRNDPEAACQLLIKAANRQGGEDNITVIVIKCE